VTLGEGFTPLIHATRLGAARSGRLYVKDESLNPDELVQGARQSAAITRARALGVTTVSVPVAGNAGNAMAAYAAKAGLAAKVFLPRDVKTPFIRECRCTGRCHARRRRHHRRGPRRVGGGIVRGWYDVSTLKEPYRIEGKKTMAYELASRWSGSGRLDRVSHRRRDRHGGDVEGLRRDRASRVGASRPPAAMVSVQATGCAPIVARFEHGARTRRRGRTRDRRRRASRPACDRRLSDPARGARERGTALAVSDAAMIDGMLELGSTEGISAAPEGGARLAAIRALVADGSIRSERSRRALQHRRRAQVSRRASVARSQARNSMLRRARTNRGMTRTQDPELVELRVASSHTENAAPAIAMTVPPAVKRGAAGRAVRARCSAAQSTRTPSVARWRQTSRPARTNCRAPCQREDRVGDDRDVRRAEIGMHAAED
jgi:threonine synthase